jgi:hypothetical protein
MERELKRKAGGATNGHGQMSGIHRDAKANESPIVFREARSLAPSLQDVQILPLDINQSTHGKHPLPL